MLRIHDRGGKQTSRVVRGACRDAIVLLTHSIPSLPDCPGHRQRPSAPRICRGEIEVRADSPVARVGGQCSGSLIERQTARWGYSGA